MLAGCDKQDISDNIPLLESTTLAKEEENAEEILISLNGNQIETDSSTVQIFENQALISQAGTFRISGKLEDGQIIVKAPDADVELIFDSVDITNNSGPAVYIQDAKDVEITLAQKSENVLSDGENYEISETEDSPNAVIFSMSDLHIKGKEDSNLTVNANYKDAIASKDDLNIKKATLFIFAKDDGIRGKDSLDIKKSNLTIEAEGDALKSDNASDEGKGAITIEESDIEITAGDDGIHGAQEVEIVSGNINVLDSYEAIEGKKITVHDGNINLVSQDDGFNVAEKKKQIRKKKISEEV